MPAAAMLGEALRYLEGLAPVQRPLAVKIARTTDRGVKVPRHGRGCARGEVA